MKEQDYTKKTFWMLLPMVIAITIPLVMIRVPGWLATTIFVIMFSPMLIMSTKWAAIVLCSYYIFKPVIYVWALVVTIHGVQNFWAIAFYILMAIQAPRMIGHFIGAIPVLISELLD